jgi:hypothetical protein
MIYTHFYNYIRAECKTCVPYVKSSRTIGVDTWLMNSSERCDNWYYDSAQFVSSTENGMPTNDLSFSHIDYVLIKG